MKLPWVSRKWHEKQLEEVRQRVWSDYYERKVNELLDKLARAEAEASEWRAMVTRAAARSRGERT